MSSRARFLSLGASVLGGLMLLCATAPAQAAEPLPGPPVRPEETPIGGALLTGTKVVYKPVAGAKFNPPEMGAASWLLADADTGEVLAAKAPHARYRPASTLKTLTAITLMPRLKPGATYKPVKADTTAEGSAVGLAIGVKYTIDQLWHALLLPSANDAASALANANGGFEKTIDQMNAKAGRLQAYDTSAKSPSGLDHDGQWTSAYDMALIGRQALSIPEFVDISSTTTYAFPDVDVTDGKRRTHTIYGENRLLNHGYPGVVAGKTGFTTEAHRTYWTAVKHGDRTLLVSMFRIDGPTEDAARTLFNWGFKHADELQPIGQLVAPLTDEQLASAAAAGDSDAATELAATAQAANATSPTPADSGIPIWRWLLIALVAIGSVIAFLRYRTLQRPSTRPVAGADTRPDPSPTETKDSRHDDVDALF